MKKMSTFDMIQLMDHTKKIFEKGLEEKLSLTKVQCPLFVRVDSGLQDALSGVEKGVSFTHGEEHYEIVHSLAKWKRDALGRYHFPIHTGLYTDMKAIRKDEVIDDIHSLFVEQWDWEKIITKKERTLSTLKKTVDLLYEVLLDTEKELVSIDLSFSLDLPEHVTYITSQELEDLYPLKAPKEREDMITREKKVVFIIGIGDVLKSGVVHDTRSPDYDDWSLDGDLLVYDQKMDKVIELTSMGIRVDEDSLFKQLQKSHTMDRISFPYHQKIMKRKLPYTIGGGIGISRILLLLLGKSHIAEVQASSWDPSLLKDLSSKFIL